MGRAKCRSESIARLRWDRGEVRRLEGVLARSIAIELRTRTRKGAVDVGAGNDVFLIGDFEMIAAQELNLYR